MKEIFHTDFNNAEENEILSILEEFSDIFDFNKNFKKSRCNEIKPKIGTGESILFRQRAYRRPSQRETCDFERSRTKAERRRDTALR